jgi:hypothetical protein
MDLKRTTKPLNEQKRLDIAVSSGGFLNYIWKNRVYIFVIILIIVGIYKIINLNNINTPIKINDSLAKKSDNFFWGIGINPYPTDKVDDTILNNVVINAKNLGVNSIKINWPDFIELGNYDYADKIVNKIYNNKLNIVMIYEPSDESLYFKKEGYDSAYNDGLKLATHYKGKIKYFQIGNEPGSYCVKKDWPGLTPESFDLDKCKLVINYLQGLSNGIMLGNPDAKIIVTGHWLHVGFFDILKDEKLHYDIIGWDWHQNSPNLLDVPNGNQSVNLVSELAKFSKEVWVTEAGIIEGSTNSEENQSTYLVDLAKQTRLYKMFKGFFIFSLYDELKEKQSNSLGIMKIKNTSGDVWMLGDPKKAYLDLFNYIRQEKK